MAIIAFRRSAAGLLPTSIFDFVAIGLQIITRVARTHTGAIAAVLLPRTVEAIISAFPITAAGLRRATRLTGRKRSITIEISIQTGVARPHTGP